MASSLNTLFDPASLPSKQAGETLVQYAMRTSGLTGLDPGMLVGLQQFASSNPGMDWPSMIRGFQETVTGQMTPEEAQQWNQPGVPPPADQTPQGNGQLGPPSITSPVTQNPIIPPQPATPPPIGPYNPAGPQPNTGAGGIGGITPPGGFLPGMGPGDTPRSAPIYHQPNVQYPGKTGGPLPTIGAGAPGAMPAPPPLPPPRNVQAAPPLSPGQAPISSVGHAPAENYTGPGSMYLPYKQMNDSNNVGLSQQQLAQMAALSQALAAPQGQT